MCANKNKIVENDNMFLIQNIKTVKPSGTYEENF